MVVSIALFGIAVSGTFLSIKKIRNPLFTSAILFSLSSVIGFFIANNTVFDPFKAVLDYTHLFSLTVYYVFLGLPFFFFGLIIAHLFSKFQKMSGKIYFYNLSGSAVGTICALLLISLFNIKAILVISLLGLASSFFFISRDSRTSTKIIVVLLLAAINLLLFFAPIEINMSEYKELSQALNVPDAKLIDTKYNSFSRVDLVESSFARYAPGLSPTFNETLPAQIGVMIDGSNMNVITKYENLGFTNHLPSTIPYFLNDKKRVLVINSGAGLDVLVGLKNNATVTAVETNPVVINLLKGEYADYSGNIYNNATVVWSEGRSFVKKNDEKFDVIIVSLAGNVLGGPSGISNLNDNYLLTKEAFRDYYDSLSEEGVLVVTRWLSFPPKESLRLFSLALEIDEDSKRTAMFRSWTTVTLLVFKNDLRDEAIEKIKFFCEKNQFDIIYLPGNFTPNKNLKFKEPYYYNAVKKMLDDKEGFYKDYVFNVKPVSDDKPFYFNFFKVSKIKELNELVEQRWNPFLDSGFLMLFILAQAALLSLILIILPIMFFRSKKIIIRRPLIYFFAIGLGYLFIEIVLIQKFTLLLGHIVFSSSTIIFSTLLFSSIGALYSQRILVNSLSKIIIITFALTIVYALSLDFIIESLMQHSLMVKIVLSMLITAPIAFFMGFPFPLGIRMIKKELVAWAWAVNGCASVLSPILAVITALFIGYNNVLLFAGSVYLVGFILSRLHQSKEQT